MREKIQVQAKPAVDIFDLAATINNLDEATVEKVHAAIKDAEDAAAPLREAREEINLQVIALQDKAKALSEKIRVHENPIRGLRKILTVGVKLGKLPGTTMEVSPAKTGANAQSVS